MIDRRSCSLQISGHIFSLIDSLASSGKKIKAAIPTPEQRRKGIHISTKHTHRTRNPLTISRIRNHEVLFSRCSSQLAFRPPRACSGGASVNTRWLYSMFLLFPKNITTSHRQKKSGRLRQDVTTSQYFDAKCLFPQLITPAAENAAEEFYPLYYDSCSSLGEPK